MTNPDELGPSQDGTVVLDIGGDVGALVLLTDASLLGAEIEINPLDASGGDVFQETHPHEPASGHTHDHGDGHVHTHAHHPDRTHVAVRERLAPDGVRYAAIYPGLRAGGYQLWNVDGTPADVVQIIGGEVAQLDWS